CPPSPTAATRACSTISAIRTASRAASTSGSATIRKRCGPIPTSRSPANISARHTCRRVTWRARWTSFRKSRSAAAPAARNMSICAGRSTTSATRADLRPRERGAAAASLLLCAGEPDDRAVILVRQQPDRTVWRDVDVADTAEGALEHPLLRTDPAASVAFEPRDELELQRADQEAAPPFGKHLAVVDCQTRGRDRRVPIVERLLHAGLLGAFADVRAVVVDAVGDDWPAVVPAGLRPVD